MVVIMGNYVCVYILQWIEYLVYWLFGEGCVVDESCGNVMVFKNIYCQLYVGIGIVKVNDVFWFQQVVKINVVNSIGIV